MSFYVMPGNVSDKNIGEVDKITKKTCWVVVWGQGMS